MIDSGRLPLFCAFASMLLTFLFIRFSVRMIRAQVRWWPGNVTSGGLHIHHVVFGIVFMVVGGVGGFALPDRATALLCVTAGLFGVGTALVLDEFALVLHLSDVYWTEAGRTSIDAMFVAIGMTGLLVLGVTPLGLGGSGGQGGPVWARILAVLFVVVLYGGLIAITLLKAKIWTGLLGIFIPLLLFVGAIRVARPHSPWARWRYRPDRRRGEARMERAQRRERRFRQPMIKAKVWVEELIGGRPDAPRP